MARKGKNWLDYRLHTGKRLGGATKADLEAEAKWCFEQAEKHQAIAEELKRVAETPPEPKGTRRKKPKSDT